MKSKAPIIITIAIIAALAIAGGAIAVITTNISANSPAALLSAAERYISELEYEQAIIELQRVIEIDPNNADAYESLIEAYEALGKYDRAENIRQEAYEATGKQWFLDIEIESGTSAPEKESRPAPETTAGFIIEVPEIEIGTTAPDSTTATIRTTATKRTVTQRSTSPALTKPESDVTEETSSAVTTVPPVTTAAPIAQGGNSVLIGGKYYSTALTELDLSGKGLKNDDIKNLSKMTNLTKLILSDNSISDISPLSGLTNLKRLNLSYNNIKKLSPLKNLTNLTYLSLHNNNVYDISDLSGLTKLTTLDICYNNISDLTPIKKIKSLTRLYAMSNDLLEIGAVGSLTNLESLYLDHNEIYEIDAISRLKKLKSIGITGNPLTDIGALYNLDNIKNIRISTSDDVTREDIEELGNELNITFYDSNDIATTHYD